MVDAAGTSRRSTGTDSSGHMAMLEIGEQAAALRRLLDRESDTGDARTTPRYPPSEAQRVVSMRVAWPSQVRSRSLLRRAV